MYKNVAAYAISADKTFSERPLLSGDAFVFASAAYGEMELSGVSLPAKMTEFHSFHARPLLVACAASKRFSSVDILYQESLTTSSPHCQFSATAFLFDSKIFVGFRGTDETVEGWLEDFDMIHMPEIPSGKLAVDFLNKIGKNYPYPLYLGGHSKGGLLSVYAAAFCEESLKSRIVKIYNFDGPGVLPEVRDTAEYQAALKKTEKYVPEMSFFGMMLVGNDPVLPIRSRGLWFRQHDHFCWFIREDGCLVPGEKIKYLAKKTKFVFHRILSSVSKDERKIFCDIVEKALAYAKIKDMYAFEWRSILKFIKYILTLKDPKERAFVRWLRKEVFLGLFSPCQ